MSLQMAGKGKPQKLDGCLLVGYPDLEVFSCGIRKPGKPHPTNKYYNRSDPFKSLTVDEMRIKRDNGLRNYYKRERKNNTR